ncbi:hypothetical protein [Rhizobium sp. CNPSo 3490]|uniref:hypothetical protein n=1 Tax=Rhizobium sp. CNPSo 3490 TaxID=3021407 RepID=UPI00254E7A12|nr:hypothetical protein [Rhizobium sp. CNPSo 3490]MDK4736457.1 hypothetical protein [Rhizobium sp. CNPSo 3490]
MTVALVSHDAGGAEILSSWALRSPEPCILVADGPAVSIFRRKCPELLSVTLREAVAAADWLLCGSGWQSGLEREAIRAGRAAGKKTVTFLDHWVNYRQRFEENGKLILPDEIRVGDIDALRIAKATFPDHPIELEDNPYLLDLRDQIATAAAPQQSQAGSGAILYVCEPIADHAEQAYGDARYFGYTEHDALRFFLDNASLLDNHGRHILIRPHPSEKAEKYAWAKEATQRPISFGGDGTLLEETLGADIVVGCESMALIVGLLAGKRVVSSIPPGGRTCQLPHAGIEHLAILETAARG